MGTCRSRLWDKNKKYTIYIDMVLGGCFFGILGYFLMAFLGIVIFVVFLLKESNSENQKKI